MKNVFEYFMKWYFFFVIVYKKLGRDWAETEISIIWNRFVLCLVEFELFFVVDVFGIVVSRIHIMCALVFVVYRRRKKKICFPWHRICKLFYFPTEFIWFLWKFISKDTLLPFDAHLVSLKWLCAPKIVPSLLNMYIILYYMIVKYIYSAYCMSICIIYHVISI